MTTPTPTSDPSVAPPSTTTTSTTTTSTTTSTTKPTAPTPRPKRPVCLQCGAPAKIKRPKNSHPLCVPHFLSTFESEILSAITSHPPLFHPGETIAIGASGGKDSTVLASILSTLNTRHSLGLNLHLLSIDEGISGYRDHSLATVKRNAVQYNLPLTILSYKELYSGWTMDSIVATVGKKANCTYCGVFRRQALDRGCELLGIKHVVTGHNADDMAETVLMNLLRGDLPRLGRCTAITTQSKDGSRVKRSKPMKYAYQKEIVLYAHYKQLDYFTTECTYAPEAFRGSARDLIKGLERVRPSAIMDVIRSGEAYARLLAGEGGKKSSISKGNITTEPVVPIKDEQEKGEGVGEEAKPSKSKCKNSCIGNCTSSSSASTTNVPPTINSNDTNPNHDDDDDEDEGAIGACGSSQTYSSKTQMHLRELELRRRDSENCTTPTTTTDTIQPTSSSHPPQNPSLSNNTKSKNQTKPAPSPSNPSTKSIKNKNTNTNTPRIKQQVLRNCKQCGYLSSQELCQACVMLEGLNRTRAKVVVEIEG